MDYITKNDLWACPMSSLVRLARSLHVPAEDRDDVMYRYSLVERVRRALDRDALQAAKMRRAERLREART